MGPIMQLARGRGAFVLEDAAQAIGARQQVEGGWVMAGAAGHAGALSFFPSKNLGGFGDGGMVATADPGIAERVAKLRVHGGRQMYHHDVVGTNSRLDALQAAVLRVKLPHLRSWTEGRQGNARRYAEGLSGVDEVVLPETAEGNEHVFNQYTIRAKDREGLRLRLHRRGIGTAVYYPVPLHLQPCFRELGGRSGDLPVAESLCDEVLSLPVFPELGEDRLGVVVDAIREFYA
jgi:dTDP-4-amino-4,6-dideoxygalactose transaminase